MTNNQSGFWERTRTEFKKSSLVEKVAFGVAVLGLVGTISGSVPQYKHLFESKRNYPLLSEEEKIIEDLNYLNQKKTFSDEKLNENYSLTLENRLKEIRTSDDYNLEKQQKEEERKNKKTRYHFLLLGILSYWLTVGACYIGRREAKKREQKNQEIREVNKK